jgi:primase-polymerase (primpol)-like protein
MIDLMSTCVCGTELAPVAGVGRPARWCSSRCRQRAYRLRQVPAELTAGHRWTRADGKRPVTVTGAPASTTDPSTWATFATVRAARSGDGFGLMLGGGLGCYDLDHVTDADVARFLATVPERVMYVERSQSGHGAHVFIEAPEAPGWRRVVDGLNVERYTRARFIRTTLQRM